jgi:CAAX protease family protein
MPEWADQMPEWADQNGGLSLTTILVFVGTVVSIAVILTWLFNHTQGSVLLAILAHSSVNTAQAVLNPLFPSVKTDLNGLLGFGALAIVILVATGGRLGYRATAATVPLAPSPARA